MPTKHTAQRPSTAERRHPRRIIMRVLIPSHSFKDAIIIIQQSSSQSYGLTVDSLFLYISSKICNRNIKNNFSSNFLLARADGRTDAVNFSWIWILNLRNYLADIHYISIMIFENLARVSKKMKTARGFHFFLKIEVS